MKVLAVSDSHGHTDVLETILRKEKDCGVLIHLGDGADDVSVLLPQAAGMQIWLTRGNCDAAACGYKEKHVIRLEGITLVACHGHRMNVRYDLTPLYFEGLKESARVCLYGHTHIQRADETGDILLLNPGAVLNGCYSVLLIENGYVGYELKNIR